MYTWYLYLCGLFLGSCLPLSCVYILENLATVGIKTCFDVVRQKLGKEKPNSHQESKNYGFLDWTTTALPVYIQLILRSHTWHPLSATEVISNICIYVPCNLRIKAIYRLRCTFSESQDCVPIWKLHTIVVQSRDRDCTTVVYNFQIAQNSV